MASVYCYVHQTSSSCFWGVACQIINMLLMLRISGTQKLILEDLRLEAIVDRFTSCSSCYHKDGTVVANGSSYSCLMSSGTPPMNRLVSRLRPSVPRGLSPSICGSSSTLSTAFLRLRVTTSWCQRPWLIWTLLTTVPVPEPVLNLRTADNNVFRCWFSQLHPRLLYICVL